MTEDTSTVRPSVEEAFDTVLAEAEWPDAGDVHRVTLNISADGTVAYRLDARGQDEPVTGVVSIA